MKDLRSIPCRPVEGDARRRAAGGQEKAPASADFEAVLSQGEKSCGGAVTAPEQRSRAKPGAPPADPGWRHKKPQPEQQQTAQVEPELRGTAAPAAAAQAPDGVDGAKPAAATGGGDSLVQQVAERCLMAIRVHEASGRSRVDLSLDLGRLGAARVSVAKTSAGGVEISFHLADADGQQLLAERLPELSQNLARRGVEVGELRLINAGGTVWKSDRPVQPPPATAGRAPSGSWDGSPPDGRSRGHYTQPEPESQES